MRDSEYRMQASYRRQLSSNRRTLPEFVLWPDGRPAQLPDWADAYLDHLCLNGGMELAAHAARVHRVTAQRLRHAQPAFDDAVHRAQSYYADSLEWHLVEQAHMTGSPLGFFGRLKAERPERWLDKSLVASLEVKAELTVTAEDTRDFLASVLQHVTPTTRALLGLPQPVDNPVDNSGDKGGTIGGDSGTAVTSVCCT